MGNLTTTKQPGLVAQTQKQPFSAFLAQDAIKNMINNVVGGKNGQRFVTSIMSAVSTNEQLMTCTHATILSAALLGESLNLSPSPQLGQYYMVPFKKKGKNGEPNTVTATFVLGYKGYIQLAIRSGYYKKINVISIKEGELIRYNPLEEEIQVNLIEDDEVREKTKTIGYYAMFEYHNGFQKTIYWSKKKMLAHADKYSAAFDMKTLERIEQGKVPDSDMWKYSSFWYKDFDGMAYKTLLRQLISKWGIMSIELQKALEADDAILDENLNPTFVENNDHEHEPAPQAQAVIVEPTPENIDTIITQDDDDPFEN